MAQAAMDLITQAMSSPWLYAALFTFAIFDALLPVVPSEAAVITAGVFAATVGPHLVPVIVAAAAGAMIGDHVSYGLGRRYGSRFVDRMPEEGRQRKAFTWAKNTLLRRGGMALVVARYIPGGRAAVTLTTGAIRFPIKTFVIYDGVAAFSWAVYCSLIGYLGGAAFEDNPLYGVALGVTLALTLTLLIELIRARMTKSPTITTQTPGRGTRTR